ncbi:major capsid protein [uncultured Fusobacterium sp.]|uniref:major capsid protein n=1 Tax=uncultured Fusobacterium sp. TaxID=159267 RepID=UPI0027DCAE0F|nr:major capsid protein [uncultured Fusobacterium sp.]
MYELKKLIAAYERMHPIKLFLWSLLIGYEKEEQTAKFEVHTKDGMRIVAPTVGRRSKGTLVKKGSFKVDTYQPSMIKPYVVAEGEALLKQQFGQTIYGNPATNANKKIAQELKNLQTILMRTLQYNLSLLLLTGVLPQEEGAAGISFGTFNSVVLSGSSKWNAVGVDIIGQLKEKKTFIQDTTGISPDTLVVSPDVASVLLDDPKFVDMQKRFNSNIVQIDPKELGSGADYIGYIPLLSLKIYSFQDLVSLDGKTNKQLLPPGTALLLKSKSFGVHYGAFPFREKPTDDNGLFIGKAAIRKLPSADLNDDELQLHSAPFIKPLDAQCWYMMKVI